MRITYDPEADEMFIRLRDGTSDEGEEIGPNVIAHFDARENVLGLEILFASKTIDGSPLAVELALLRRDTAGPPPAPESETIAAE